MFREKLFEFPTAVLHDPAVEEWFKARGDLGVIARRWFDVMRSQGEDVRELLHDHHPTACVGAIAFGYVNAFTSHVNVGFFQGTELPDPHGLLEGSGKFMRHVKIRPGETMNEAALTKLIQAAYTDVKSREEQ